MGGAGFANVIKTRGGCLIRDKGEKNHQVVEKEKENCELYRTGLLFIDPMLRRAKLGELEGGVMGSR